MASKRDFKVLGDSMVTLHIKISDEESQIAHVHENLLCTASPIFKAVIQGFEEASTKTITIKDTDDTTFEDFIYWLYHEKCKSSLELVRYAKLKKFANEYNIAWLKYDVGLATFDTIQAHSINDKAKIVPPFVHQAYANSTPGDTIRKVLVAIYVHGILVDFYKSMESKQCLSGCPEFGSDVAIEMGMNLEKLASYYRSHESYEIHASTFPKPSEQLEAEEDVKPAATTKSGSDFNKPSAQSPKRRRKGK